MVFSDNAFQPGVFATDIDEIAKLVSQQAQKL